MASTSGMKPTVVLDNGSFSVKLGLAGEEYPRFCVRPCHESGGYMCRGLVTCWERLEKMWTGLVHNSLRVDPEDRALLVTDLPLSPPLQRIQLVEVALESLGFCAVYVTSPAVLTLYNLGRHTGLLLDVGHGSTYGQAVFEGYSLPHVTVRYPLGGQDLDEFLKRRLGPRTSWVLSDEEIRFVKEKWCYTLRGDAVMETLERLPDGKAVAMGELAGLCGEVLMSPAMLIGRDVPGLGQQLRDCLRRADIDLRRPLASQVVLCGGSASLPGLPARLARDLGFERKPTVVSSVAAWRGGSILASSDFPAVSRAEVAELGPYRALAKRGMLAS